MTEDTENNASDGVIVEQVEEKRKGGRPVGSFKVKTTDNGSFLRSGGHELDKAIKKSAKCVEEMLDVLADVATNKNNDPKERRAAAKDYLDFHAKIIEQRNKDEITRKIAEVRVRGVLGGGSTDDDDTPQLDFENIHPDFRDNQTVEMPDTNKELDN